MYFNHVSFHYLHYLAPMLTHPRITALVCMSILETITVHSLLKHSVRTNQVFFSFLFFGFRLRGSYQNLHGGYLSDALVDLTGGVQVQFSLKDPPPDLEEIVKAADKSHCLMGCSTSSQVNHRARSMAFLGFPCLHEVCSFEWKTKSIVTLCNSYTLWMPGEILAAESR